jgi:hypothetical protein
VPAAARTAAKIPGADRLTASGGWVSNSRMTNSSPAAEKVTDRRPRRFATRSRVVVVDQDHPHFARVAIVCEDEGQRLVNVRLDGASTSTVIRRTALVATTR